MPRTRARIAGWIEMRAREDARWSGVVRLDSILSRDYDAFGSLLAPVFGGENVRMVVWFDDQARGPPT